MLDVLIRAGAKVNVANREGITPLYLASLYGNTQIIETLLTSDPVLIANPIAAADPAKRAAMDDLVTLLRGALEAEGRVLIKLNVAAEHLDGVLTVVPSMKAPTVSSLSEGGFAIETVVDKRGVNRLLPELKAAGATDILELPISKIIP